MNRGIFDRCAWQPRDVEVRPGQSPPRQTNLIGAWAPFPESQSFSRTLRKRTIFSEVGRPLESEFDEAVFLQHGPNRRRQPPHALFDAAGGFDAEAEAHLVAFSASRGAAVAEFAGDVR
jgi:hypothetical protein